MTEVEQSREELEGERDFLLRSLDDLEAELIAGNIDPDSYRELHDDYTARASAVIRALSDNEPPSLPPEPNLPRVWRFITIGGIILFCVLGAFLLAQSVGQREPGRTATGNDQATTGSTAPPNSYAALIAEARAALQSGDLPSALTKYSAASRADPKQAEPYAYRGLIGARAAQVASDENDRATLLGQANNDFNRAIAVDPNYLDTYLFKASTLIEVEKRPRDAVPLLQHFLATAPQTDSRRPAVQSSLAQALGAPSPTTTKP
jgi:tetratricopeptide (TPR) repeat protein